VEVEVNAPSSYAEWLSLAGEQQARFWSKVDRATSCWLWTAGKDKDGYGKFQVNSRRDGRQVQKHFRAHRLAWELEHGQLAAGLLLMHSCDTPACCNPAHLSPGTQLQNRADCARKRRTARTETHGDWVGPARPRGTRHGMASITEAVALRILELRATGMSCSRIAAATGASVSVCYRVCSGATWRHVRAETKVAS
jgi:hypothetical protein